MVCVHVLHGSFLTDIVLLRRSFPIVYMVKYPWNIWPKNNHEWNFLSLKLTLVRPLQGHLTSTVVYSYFSCYSCTHMIFTCCPQTKPMNRLPGRVQGETNKQKQTGKPNEFLQSNRPSLQDLPHRLYSLLINWFPSIMWWGACSQANVSMYCCTYAIVACIYKQHRNSKQAFLRLKLTGHIKKPRFPLISILVST